MKRSRFSNLNVSQVSVMLLTIGILGVACSSKPTTVNFPSGTDARAELEKVQNRLMNDLSVKQSDKITPTYFAKAQEATEKANHLINEGKSNDDVLKQIGLAAGYADEIERSADAHEVYLRPVLDARRAAINARAPELATKKMQAADRDLEAIGKTIEKHKFAVDAMKMAKLSNAYSDAELDAIVGSELGQIQALIESAEKGKARDRVPLSYEMAKSSKNAALEKIKAYRRQPLDYKEAVAAANESAVKLVEVLSLSKENNASENTALKLYNQQQQVANEKKNVEEMRNRLQKNRRTIEQEAKLSESREKSLAAQEVIISSQRDSIDELQKKESSVEEKKALDERIATIQKQFDSGEADIFREQNKLIVRLKQMQFKSASAELNYRSRKTLEKVKALIAAGPVSRVLIQGHTDSIGPSELNQSLSTQRAETVKEYFISQNVVPAVKFEAEGLGDNKPISTNKTAEGRAQNRRVDVVIDTENK